MSQGGLKHAATESRLDTKRERRRGAAGRAAALRRAPSDSDCSGETASLSADSGDRAIRPIPQPARSGKSRSRRRGSEWEVLEGLKDGQRFEKRPDVFNGYLHKKRKWPLKGWHKRYFVVDGGILVYARSPTDVARGRLHGSVDVGLSVISAKARRRRIDIDADEFIYHLRAKTPDVFRTWLNVLKAHRLYRQHLLTFGARESVPKIHAPLEDLPPNDTSSRSSCISMVTAESSSMEDLIISSASIVSQRTLFSDIPSSITKKSIVDEKTIKNEDSNIADDEKTSRAAINLSVVNVKTNDSKSEDVEVKDVPVSEKSKSDHRKNPKYKSFYVATQFRKRSKTNIDITRQIKNNSIDKKPSLIHNIKLEPTTAYFFCTKKKNFRDYEYMQRSRKSTNLVKYKNILDEPKLKRPLSKCMLLGRFPALKLSEPDDYKQLKSETLSKEPETLHVIMQSKEFVNSSIQDTMSASEYSEITEKVLLSMFKNRNSNSSSCESDVKSYINKIVEELYEVKLHQYDTSPVKTLFRCLLEFWLKNNKNKLFQNVTLTAKSVGPEYSNCFTVDKEVSSVRLSLQSKGTQYDVVTLLDRRPVRQPQPCKNTNDTSKLVGKPPKFRKEKLKPPSHSPRRDTESFEKERRVQELERVLKNTIYVCDVQSFENKEKDVKITKALLDNLGRSKNAVANKSSDINYSSSSAEVPKIQETIDHLISDTSMPPDVAKEFLNAYLDVLNTDTSKSATTNSTSPSGDIVGKAVEIDCDVQTEAVQKKISKSVITDRKGDKVDFAEDKKKIKDVDPGQQYLKDILDKVTTIFSRINLDRGQKTGDAKPKVESKVKDELGRSVNKYPGKNLIREDYDTNSVIIDLSKYDLEHISMFSDPNMKDIMSITIKLKEKLHNSGETQKAHLSLKFSEEGLRATRPQSKQWIKVTSNSSSTIFDTRKQKCKRSILDFSTAQQINDLKPYVSSCDITSKAYCRIVHESEHSLDLSFKSSKFYQHSKKIEKKEDPQSCYIMSFQKKNLATKSLKTKKKVRLKECHGLILNSRTNSSTRQKCGCPEEYAIFERPAPKLIDEKFILTLLENLTFLSKDLPAVYKDINSLYIKLKKKHEKVVKTCNNVQGLSLLGKIYNEESIKPNDIETQASASKSTTQVVYTNKEAVATNTSGYIKTDVTSTDTGDALYKKVVSTNTSNVLNKKDMPTSTSKLLNNMIATNTSEVRKDGIATSTSVSVKCTCGKKKSTREKEMLTEAFVVEIEPHYRTGSPKNYARVYDYDYNNSWQTIDHCDSSFSREITADQAVSGQNWYNKVQTEDCAVSTVIKCILNKTNDVEDNSSNFGNMETSLEISMPKKRRTNQQHNLIHETRLLSPTSKVSTPSQTERNFLNTDFHVYQLQSYFAEKEVNYLNDSSEARHFRSEIKLLYKCRSAPSLASESGGPLENASRELGQAQLSVQQLQRLLDALELQQQVHHDTDVSLEGASPNVKKDRRKFGLRKKKSNSKCASVELTSQHIDPSTSHMALSALTAPPSPGGGASSIPNSAASLPIACAAARPQSLPGAEALATGNNAGPASLTSLTPDHQLREDFTVLAKDLVANLKTIVSTLVCERGRLRAAMEAADSTAAPPGGMVAALRTNLSSALQQNSELRSRLSRIHDASDLAEISSMGPNDPVVRQFQQSLSYSSSCVSASEFFDAEEHEDEAIKAEPIIQADEAGVIELDGDSSSEAGSLSSEEGSASSDNSDGAMPSVEQPTLRLNQNGISETGTWSRRTRLPCARPTPGGPSLWNLLYKNIGKDLSQVSMPVTINEPLNMLQRLCEELEYSELLDSAADCGSAIERMALVAAFAVSAYASSAHRAASKPFNPLLAETYECIRDDKGFRFIAEQVSHHPPISACHAESSRWRFWQEARIKTKFWGKSMEFQPAGRVHVRLATGDHYSWNKVTTCVHNLFGGQRWVDQYGDMHITCHGTDITCKLNFIKASSWSSTRHEVRGAVTSGSSGARLRLQGRWSEALYAGEPPAARCLWRPGAMPPEHELYYGFTRFAMELNEMEPGMRDVLPHTDTRFRPDQRALEEGDVEAAEQHKHQLEQAQRERRRDAASHQPAWFRKALEGGEETWVSTGEYWAARDAGFPALRAPRIW